jgi:hypothetical protein
VVVREAGESLETGSPAHPALPLPHQPSHAPIWGWDEATPTHQLPDDAGIFPGVLQKGSD